MGKAENIKRAKKLKEAKRQREQIGSSAAGLGPSSRIVQERSAKNGARVVLNQSAVKYSALLKEFMTPIIGLDDDLSMLRVKFTFGLFAWNAATVRAQSEQGYLLARKESMQAMPDVPGKEELFDEMVEHKQELFSAYENVITDFELTKKRGHDYHLTVATTPLKNLVLA